MNFLLLWVIECFQVQFLNYPVLLFLIKGPLLKKFQRKNPNTGMPINAFKSVLLLTIGP